MVNASRVQGSKQSNMSHSAENHHTNCELALVGKSEHLQHNGNATGFEHEVGMHRNGAAEDFSYNSW